MNNFSKYRFVCTLQFGDIYGQIIIWLAVILLTLASAMALMGSSKPYYAIAMMGLILVISLPFLLFAFVTTLLNHIELRAIDPVTEASTAPGISGRPAQAAG